MTEELYKKVSSRIEADWFPYHENEWFTHTDICMFFQWDDPEIRKEVSKKLYHDSTTLTEPKLEKNNKAFKLIDKSIEEIDWDNADPEDVYQIKLPYDIQTGEGFPFQNRIWIPPRGLVVVAGSSNAGKTTFLLNMMVRNMDKFKCVYFTSELSAVALKRRLMPFEDWYELRNGDGKPKFKILDRSDNYHEAISPTYSDYMVFVDYLDVNNEAEYFKLKPYIKRIKRAMRNGIAVVALQKRPGSDDAYGGANLRGDADLYIAMDFGKLKVIKAKDYVPPDPNNTKYSFDISYSGAMFNNIQEDLSQ